MKKMKKINITQKQIIYWLLAIPIVAVIWAFATSAIMFAISLIK